MTESARLSGSDAKRAARNVSVLMAASVISKGALYLWQIALSVLLGPSEYGIYGTVGGMMVTAASVAGFGMGLIVIRDVAREPQKAGKYWTVHALRADLAGARRLCRHERLRRSATATRCADSPRWPASTSSSTSSAIWVTTCWWRKKSWSRTSLVEIVHIAVRIALAWLALTAGWGLLGVYCAAIMSGICRSIALVGLNLRAGVRPQFPFDWTTAKPLLINSAPLALSAFPDPGLQSFRQTLDHRHSQRAGHRLSDRRLCHQLRRDRIAQRVGAGRRVSPALALL